MLQCMLNSSHLQKRARDLLQSMLFNDLVVEERNIIVAKVCARHFGQARCLHDTPIERINIVVPLEEDWC